MKKNIKITIFVTFLILLTASLSYAQSSSFTIKLNRDFGYGGFNGDIQGRFSLKVTSDEDLSSVTYFIDDQEMATLTSPPFRLQFVTDTFDPGWHTISAQGTFSDGTIIQSNEVKREFVAKDATWDKMKGILIPVLGITLLISIGFPLISARNKKNFELGVYGIKGGAVCKKCQLPFTRSYFAPNMVIGKLEKCPHCGKMQITISASTQNLESAEKRYASSNQGSEITQENEEDKLKKMIENSKFDN